MSFKIQGGPPKYQPPVNHPRGKHGKKPFQPDTRDLKFAKYTASGLPAHPVAFGHDTLLPPDAWGMMGNDSAPNCVEAGAVHETMLWTAEANDGNPVGFTTADAVSDWRAITGWKGDPSDPNAPGTDVRTALKYRQKTGIVDASGKRHKIGAYLLLDTWSHVLEALYLFSAVGIGFNFPASADQQFAKGKPWSVVHGSAIEGGHYVPVIAHRSDLVVVTWGRNQKMTEGFFNAYVDEAWALLSPEFLVKNESPEGFDLAQLTADLKLL